MFAKNQKFVLPTDPKTKQPRKPHFDGGDKEGREFEKTGPFVVVSVIMGTIKGSKECADWKAAMVELDRLHGYTDGNTSTIYDLHGYRFKNKDKVESAFFYVRPTFTVQHAKTCVLIARLADIPKTADPS